jgi:hypothetical protein
VDTLYGSKGDRLVSPRLETGFLRQLTIRYLGSVAVYAIAVMLSLVDFRLGLGICIGLTLLYLLPPPKPRFNLRPAFAEARTRRIFLQ